jgi:hypothetical protein
LAVIRPVYGTVVGDRGDGEPAGRSDIWGFLSICPLILTTRKHLNSIAVVFEYEADAEGNTKSKLWEWK